MTQREYIIDRITTLSEISKITHYSVFRLLCSYGVCRVLHGADFDQFCTFHMYDLNNHKRAEYLTTRRCRRVMKVLDRGATPEDISALSQKCNFNRNYRDFIQRPWLFIPDSTPEQIRAFIDSNPKFLVKTSFGTWGEDIHLFENSAVDFDAFMEQYGGKPYLLEAFICQHPAMAALNPSSVNTVRVITAKLGDRVLLVGSGLRCGGAGQFVDNFNHGGVAYPIDINTGIVTGPGQNPHGEVCFLRHPSTGHILPGFQIPNWDILCRTVRDAALVSPRVGYTGWDVAVTESGVDLIEGNVRLPGTCVIQLDGPGAYARLKEFIRAAD